MLVVVAPKQEHNPGESERYNKVIVHETLRVAVCDAMEDNRCPEQLLLVEHAT